MADQTSKQRLTKAERKEEARRQREELQRKMAASRRNRRIAIGLVVVLIAGVSAYVVLTRPQEAKATPAELLASADRAQQAAGCGKVDTVGPYQPKSQDRAHIVAQLPLSTYPSVPPTSGPHNAIPYGAGEYSTPPPIDRVIHSLEHGAAIVWYSPNVSGTELDRIRTFYEDAHVGSRVIVAPYDYPDQGAAGSLPAGSQMALVAWHRLQLCSQVNLAAAFGFTSSYAAPPFGQQAYQGEAPEAGGNF
ncbi:MAG: DUF3105 domain-containing protein [Actinomycetota bacterium]